MASRKRSARSKDEDRPTTPEDGVIELPPPPPPPPMLRRLPPHQHPSGVMVTPHRKGGALEQRVTATMTVLPPSRELFPTHGAVAATITPLRKDNGQKPPAKRRLIFGKSVVEIEVKASVKQVYQIVKKRTGAIGGNASAGPIYGELTVGSMQRMVNLMKEHAEFNESSRFIDVGSGVGKPNLHVAQDPGVALSYGIEVEPARWLLSMHGLDGLLAAMDEQGEDVLDEQEIQGRCMFVLGDIRQAKTFDPFTHVYMFSIGFPPKLWHALAEMWNRSSSTVRYMICFHGPKHIIDCYEFNVELLVQTPTSMHGSKEGHTGYIYRRKMVPETREGRAQSSAAAATEPCDPFFASTWELVNGGFDRLKMDVQEQLKRIMETGVSTRSRRSPPNT